MNAALVDTATLNACTRAANSSVDAALAVVARLAEADVTGQAPDPEALRDLADEANGRAQQTYQLLRAAGGREPDGHAAGLPLAADPDPLRALLLADTPAARRLLEALRAAAEAAEAVDLERGNVLPPDFPLQPGETRGTGWAETISNLAQRLKIEVEGPSRARGRE
jgi:hypothetical protein